MARSIFILLSSFLLFPFVLFAGREENVSGVIRGGEIAVSSNLFSVQDDKYPNQSSVGYISSSSGIVVLGFDHGSDLVIPANTSYSVKIRIRYKDKINTEYTSPEYTLEIKSGDLTTDQDIVRLPGAHYMEVEVLESPLVNGVAAVLPDNVTLKGIVEVERYYPFNETVSPVLQSPASYNSGTGELEIRWDYLEGAEEYELEYSYIDDYQDGAIDNARAASSLSYDFANNSTRIITNNQYYRIPVVYDRGYLVYRVRGVGRGGASYNKRKEGLWSSPATGTVDVIASKYRISEVLKENRQFSAAFSEEGKRKDIMSHFDGSLRNRQTLTKTNSNNNLIIGETIYDGEGRPAIQVLPVPVSSLESDQTLRYHTAISRNSSGQPYSFSDFDLGDCETATSPMGTSSGASQYFSSANPDRTDEKAYIPDANGYPFVQVEYTPDNTGRIRRQSGLGDSHKLGSDHETKYYYGQPEQEELDRLLGTSSGYASHYKKNLVIDANGQISVSYVDGNGAVVATALSGKNPDNLEALTDEEGNIFSGGPLTITQIGDCPSGADKKLCNPNNRKIDNALVFNKEILISNEGLYTFNYDVTPEILEPACFGGGNVCYDCVYNFEFSITDECGNYVKDVNGNDVFHTEVLGNYDDITKLQTCEGGATYTYPAVQCTLKVGNYTVTKKLVVNEAALQTYIDKHIETCTKPIEAFVTEHVNDGEIASDCEEIDCKTCFLSLSYSESNGADEELSLSQSYAAYLAAPDPALKLSEQEYKAAVLECKELCSPVGACEASYGMMLSDMSPGGQYASLDKKSADWSLSIFNEGNYLPAGRNIEGMRPSWRLPFGAYQDDMGNDTWIPVLELSDNPNKNTDYDPAVKLDIASVYRVSGENIVERVSFNEDGILVKDPAGDIVAVRPQFLLKEEDFRNAWRRSWAKALVQYHPEYCYYESCLSESEVVSSKGYSSVDFDERLQLLESFADASQSQDQYITVDGQQVVNPLYDSRFSGPLLDPLVSELTDLLDQDPYFVQHPDLKEEMLNKLTSYKKIDNQSISVKQYSAVTARCSGLFYASYSDLNSLECLNFGTGSEQATLDQEWQAYRAAYLSEKQTMQRNKADLHCLRTSSSLGYNGCIGNKDFFPFNRQFMYFQNGLWSFGFNRQQQQPCGRFSYMLYQNKIPRFQRPENLTPDAGLCSAESDEEVLEKLQKKGELEYYLQTGQCPMGTSVEAFVSEVASSGAIYTTENFSLKSYNSFSKLLFDYLTFGTENPTEEEVNSKSYPVQYWLYNNAVSDAERILTISNTTGNVSIPSVDFRIVFEAGQEYIYTDDNGSAHTINLNFNQVQGQYVTRIQSITNLTHTSTNTVTGVHTVSMTAVIGIYESSGFSGLKLVDQVQQVRLYGETALPVGSCDFSNVCEISQQYRNLEKLLSGISAAGNFQSADILLTDATGSDPGYYEPLFTADIKSHLPYSQDYVFTSTVTGSSARIEVYPQGSTNLLMAINLSAVTPVDFSKIVYLTCIQEGADASAENDFVITAFHDPLSDGNLTSVDLNGTVEASCGSCIPFSVLSCGPAAPQPCRTVAHENTENLGLFLEELVTTFSKGNPSSGNTVFYGGASVPTAGNVSVTTPLHTFLSTLKPQLPEGDYYWQTTSISVDGTTLIAEIVPIDPVTGAAGEGCDFTLSFVNKPANVDFDDIKSFGGLKADYSKTDGLNTYAFTVFADCYVSGINFPVVVKLEGSSCFPVENCETGCFAGSENLVINGDFSDATLNAPDPDCVEQCDCAVMDYTWTGPNNIYPNHTATYPRYTNPTFNSDYCLLQQWDGYGWGSLLFVKDATAITGGQWDGKDHTGNNGFFLFSDNKHDPTNYRYLNHDRRVWYQEIQVEPGETYNYSAWLMNMNQINDPNDPNCNGCLINTNYSDNTQPGTNYCTTDKPDEFEVALAISHNGNVIHLIQSNKLTCQNGWQKVATSWTAPDGVDKVTIAIVNNAGYYYGADLGLDDIVFSKACHSHGIFHPEEPVVENNSCQEHLTNVATLNAQLEYDRYIIQQRAKFREDYLEKCLSAAEHLTYSYEDKEFHQTLYFYDQAGNLVRTVPPAGVDVLDQDEIGLIRNDRLFNKFTLELQPKHTLATTYFYNSLNQLVGQLLPDHMPMDIWSSSDAASGIPAGWNVQDVSFSDSDHGYVIANDEQGNSHIFVTSDGGLTWHESVKVGVTDLKDVQVLSSAEAVATGSGGVLLVSSDAGVSWQVKPVGNGKALVALHFTTLQTGRVFEANGSIYRTSDGGNSWTRLTSLSSVMTGTLTDVHIEGQTGYAVSSDGGRGYVYKTGNGGDSWERVDDITGRDLATLSFPDAFTGYSGGKGGILLKTTDEGAHWKVVNGSLLDDIAELHFITANTGCMRTSTGKLLTTSNGGVSWSEPKAGSVFDDLYFIAGTIRGYALGQDNTLILTTDGGASWGAPTPIGAGDLQVISFSDNNTGFAAGASGVIYRTLNGGTSWTSIQGTLAITDIKDVHFKDSKQGCVLTAAGSVYFTLDADGEAHAGTAQWGPATGAADVTSFNFRTGETGYAVTSAGDVLTTSNTGGHWSSLTSSPQVTGLQDVVFTSDLEGYLAGTGGTLYRSADGGASWENTSKIIPGPLYAVNAKSGVGVRVAGADGDIFTLAGSSFVFGQTASKSSIRSVSMESSSSGYAVADQGVIFRTIDGSTWNIETYAASEDLNSVVVSGASVYAAGKNGMLVENSSGVWQTKTTGIPYNLEDIDSKEGLSLAVGINGTILKRDASGTWQNVTSLGTFSLNATHMTGQSGYAVGDNGIIVKTTDAGVSWNAVAAPVPADPATGEPLDLNGVYFTTASSGYVTGDRGLVLFTSDGGGSWTQINTGITSNLNDVYASSSQAIVVGDNGSILTFSGTAFINRTNATVSTANLNAVFFTTSSTGYAAGTSGTILRTIDGGASWTASSWGQSSLNDIYFTDALTGYAVGSGGTLLKTVNAGDSWLAQDAGAGSAELNSIAFTSHTKAVMAGSGGTVQKLNDERDRISTRFWYDELGRLVLSQNSKQYNYSPKGYSYTRYDELGGVIESGEVLTDSPAENLVAGTQVPYSSFESWLANAETGKRQVKKVYYDVGIVSVEGFTQDHTRNRVAAMSYQENISSSHYDNATHYSYDIHGNVKTLIQENRQIWTVPLADAGSKENPYQTGDQRIKRMDYIYDLISGNVHEIAYQADQKDQFYHRYHYDADNRLTNVFTTKDKIVWDQDIKCFYYDHGPITRVETGEHKVQGIDYSYTIQGWIKAVNSNTLQSKRDIGKDGDASATINGIAGLHAKIGKDEFGYSLGYFKGDYLAIGTPLQENHALVSLAGSDYEASQKDLYNGNISFMITSIGKFMDNSGPLGTSYRYDQLNRIKQVDSYTDVNLKTSSTNINLWGATTYTPKWGERFTYDANGNILSATRNGDAQSSYPEITGMDNMEYIYETIGKGYERNTNKLRQVIDHTATDQLLDDFEPGQGENNYSYDEIGNLSQDEQAYIEQIIWRADGKIKEVIKDKSFKQKDTDLDGNLDEVVEADLEFIYDASGQRVGKIVKHHKNQANGLGLTEQEHWQYTWYTRDASGSVMAVYKKSFTENNGIYFEKIRTEERHIYGYSRLGMQVPREDLAGLSFQASYDTEQEFTDFTNISPVSLSFSEENQITVHLGQKMYEMCNHLGNVLIVVTDRKIGVDLNFDGSWDEYTADIASAQGYYAFGAVLDGMSYVSEKYRYGYQRQEKDDEFIGNGNFYAFEYRIHDARIGRFLSIDPLYYDFPWNSPYAFSENRVLDGVELEGLEVTLLNGETGPFSLEHAKEQNVTYNNGYRTPDGKFASPNGARPLAGAEAEELVWKAIEQKEGWKVTRGRIYVKDATGQVRVYDGIAHSPSGENIGIEVKSNSAQKDAKQRNFDTRLNSSKDNTASGIGKSKDIKVTRSIEIRVEANEVKVAHSSVPKSTTAATSRGILGNLTWRTAVKFSIRVIGEGLFFEGIMEGMYYNTDKNNLEMYDQNQSQNPYRGFVIEGFHLIRIDNQKAAAEAERLKRLQEEINKKNRYRGFVIGN